MTQNFADAVPAICGLAAQLLNWRPAEFWTATPTELAMALSDPKDQAISPCTREQLNMMMEAENNG